MARHDGSSSLVWLVPGVQAHVDLESVLRHEALAALGAVELGRAVGRDVQLQPPLGRARPLTDVAAVPATESTGRGTLEGSSCGLPQPFRQHFLWFEQI